MILELGQSGDGAHRRYQLLLILLSMNSLTITFDSKVHDSNNTVGIEQEPSLLQN